MRFEPALNDSKDIAFTHYEVVFALKTYFSAGILAIKDRVTFFYHHRFIFFARAGSDDGATLWFFFCCVGDDDASGSFFFSSRRFNDYPVVQRSNACVFSHNYQFLKILNDFVKGGLHLLCQIKFGRIVV